MPPVNVLPGARNPSAGISVAPDGALTSSASPNVMTRGSRAAFGSSARAAGQLRKTEVVRMAGLVRVARLSRVVGMTVSFMTPLGVPLVPSDRS